MGYTMGPIVSHYLAMPNGHQVVMMAMGGTATIFVGLSACALTSRKDFSFIGGFLLAGSACRETPCAGRCLPQPCTDQASRARAFLRQRARRLLARLQLGTLPNRQPAAQRASCCSSATFHGTVRLPLTARIHRESPRSGPGSLNCPKTSAWGDEHRPPDLLIGASPRQMVRH